MPVHGGARPEQLDRALRSLHEQTQPAAEVVIVDDEPLPDSIASTIAAWDERLPLHLVHLPERRGIGYALDEGLRATGQPLIARMDADDIALPTRFQRQAEVMSSRGLDLLGTALLEFDSDEHSPGQVRHMPVGQEAIRRRLRWNNPFAHPSVMFRRAAALEVGSYAHLPMLEDYDLWARMFAAGAAMDNLDEALLLYRSTAATYKRRGAVTFRREADLAKRLRGYGVVGPIRSLAALALRYGFSIAPTPLKRAAMSALASRATRR